MKKLAQLIEGGAPRTEAPLPAAQASAELEPTTGGSGGGYSGADHSMSRGMVYFPQMDTRKEINPYNRKELSRRARWAYANLGIVRRAINGLARMVVGNGLTPQPLTDDKEWNQLAIDIFNRRTSQAQVFDLAEKYNFTRAQLAILRQRLKDGDMGVALSKSATNRARFAFYESHQIGTARYSTSLSPFDTEGWYDGVFTNRLNAAKKYRVLGDGDTHVDIPRRDFLHQVDFERSGQRRGVTVLAHAINNLLDITEIKKFVKQGIKVSSERGYYIADKATPQTSGGGSGPAAAMAAGMKQITSASGDPINVGDVYGQGGTIANIPDGKDLKVLLDQRPHPNTVGFLDYLIRDIAWGVGISPELLWDITKLGGANNRYALADAQCYIEEQQQLLVDQFCSPVWNYTIAKEIKAGTLRRCEDPNWMFKMGWIPPARITVDYGRDGKLHLEQMRSGMLTFKKFYGWQGQDWKPQMEQWIDERAYMIQYAKDQHDMTPEQLMSTMPKQPAVIATESDGAADD